LVARPRESKASPPPRGSDALIPKYISMQRRPPSSYHMVPPPLALGGGRGKPAPPPSGSAGQRLLPGIGR
jgi:hypothetical protein